MSIDQWKVLVVEDEPDSIHLVSELMSHYGSQVFSATNGVEAIAMLSDLQPTIIVMDLAMPEKDGWQTLREIRANPDIAGIPVVAITAYHSASVAQDAINAGFDAYFPKPVDPDHFLAQLSKLVEG